MSLANRLSERRENANEKCINDFVQMFIPKVEAHVDADLTSRHIEVRLEFEERGNEAILKLNNKVVETFDVSNLLGTMEEKFFEILNALIDEGFENKTERKTEYYGSESSEKEIFAIGFDI